MKLFQNRIEELIIPNAIIRRSESSRMMLLYFNKFEPNVRIEDAVTPKKGRTLIVKNHVEFAVELAAQNKQEDTDTQVNKAL